MGNLMKGIKVAAYIAEIIVASSVVVELVEKYGGKSKKRQSASKAKVEETTAETN